MREILFKAKRVDNGELVEGFYTEQWHETTGGDYTNDSVLHIMYPAVEYYQVEPEGYEVIPETVCQYTGLRDKNGQRIFEGDIFEFADTKYSGEYKKQISFDRGMWCESFVEYPDRTSKFNVEQCDSIIITGNIHDTTEATK